MKKKFKDRYDDAVLVNSQAVLEGALMYDTVFLTVSYVLSLILIFKHLNIGEFAKILLLLFMSKTMLTLIYTKGKEYVTMFKTNLVILREERAKNEKRK